ncbi:MAG TPA: TIGR01777 family oxidoreductase [Pyrinomonadaceae bacterium]
MKIVIPGGSGQVGTILARAFHDDGHEVVVISRKATHGKWPTLGWDGDTLGEWADEIDGADVVINLAGRSVNCRYNAKNCREIIDSRVRSTRVVGEAIGRAKNPPRVWLQASTATIYSHRFDAPNDDIDGIIGGSEKKLPRTWSFSIEVATRWERAANEAETPDTRKILMRSAIVLSPDHGGIFDTLLGLMRRGLGGAAGSGDQYISWIHDKDLVRSLYWLIEHEELSGPVNLSAPQALTNRDFMRILRDVWGTSIGLPATKWMLEIGAFCMRTETELILKSRRVSPRRLLDSGFAFEFELWEHAAKDLCRRWREHEHEENE